jgi:hypothetical protein
MQRIKDGHIGNLNYEEKFLTSAKMQTKEHKQWMVKHMRMLNAKKSSSSNLDFTKKSLLGDYKTSQSPQTGKH